MGLTKYNTPLMSFTEESFFNNWIKNFGLLFLSYGLDKKGAQNH